MSDAPERIWATEDKENGGEDRFHTVRHMNGLTEYIRADLHEAGVARLREALRNLVGVDCAYDGRNIIIPAVNHGDAIRLVMEARAALAQPPHSAPSGFSASP